MIWGLIAAAIIAIAIVFTRSNRQLFQKQKGDTGREDPWRFRTITNGAGTTEGSVIQLFDDQLDQSFQKSGAFAGWAASGKVRLLGDEWETASVGIAKAGDDLDYTKVSDNAIDVTFPQIPPSNYITTPAPSTGVHRLAEGTDEQYPCVPDNSLRGASTAWREEGDDLIPKDQADSASDDNWTVSGDDISPNNSPVS